MDEAAGRPPGDAPQGGALAPTIPANSPAPGSPAANSPAANSPAANSPAANSPAPGSPAPGSPAPGSPALAATAAAGLIDAAGHTALGRPGIPGRGEAVGRFLVLGELGAGGMGVVLSAYDPQLDRKVAIKLVRAGSSGATEGARARLLREAQAMARLAHEHVITVFEVGTYGEQVFLAMEYVEGTTLRGWLAERPRTRQEVVATFLAAGRGLAAAHGAGLVHRDFKPDNVLVGRDGRIRVTDFGLARDASASPAAAEEARVDLVGPILVTPLTRTGSLLGTPAYMAPEQHHGRPADARADQFAFAVALHEALYGERPFAGETYAELALAVTEGRRREPPRRSGVPAAHHAAIVRALATRPEDRHASMDELLAILARDPAARRRRALALTGALGIVVLGAVGITGGLGDAAPRCPPPTARLAGIWDPAQKAKVREAFLATGRPEAAETYGRVERILDRYAGAWQRMHVEACEATNVRGEQSATLLDLRMTCLGDRLTELRALAGTFGEIDAAMVEHAVRAADGLAPLERCADAETLTRAVPPPADPTLRARVDALRARYGRAQALFRLGKLGEALAVAEALARDVREVPHAPVRAEGLALLAELQVNHGQREAASATYREAIGAAAEARHDLFAAMAWTSLFGLAVEDPRLGGELPALRLGAEATVARAGRPPRLRALLAQRRGAMLEAKGDLAGARRAYEEAVAHGVVEGEPGHLQSQFLGSLGHLLSTLGEHAEARRVHERALTLVEAEVGPTHPFVARALTNLAVVAAAEGKYAEAVALYERALGIYDAAHAPDPHIRAAILANLGGAHFQKGDHAAARRSYERALEVLEEHLAPGHPSTAQTLVNLAMAELAGGDPRSARRHLARALELQEKTLPPGHAGLGYTHLTLANALLLAGELGAARTHGERARAIWREALGPGHANLTYVERTLGEIALRTGDREEARRSYARAVAIAEKANGPDHPDVAHALTGLGRALVRLGRAAEAKPLAERALRVHEAAGSDGEARADTRLVLAQVALAQGRRAEALALGRRAREELAGETGATARELRAEVETLLAGPPRPRR